MNPEIEMKSVSELVSAVEELKNDGCRLVVMTCSPAPDAYDITYSFDKEGSIRHIRINAEEGAEIPSITGVYPGAFVYENEIHDLYGFTFKGLSIDFGGTFIRTSVPYPFRKQAAEPNVTKVPKAAKAGDEAKDAAPQAAAAKEAEK